MKMKNKRLAFCAVCLALMVMCTSVFANTGTYAAEENYITPTAFVGADATQMNFVWLSNSRKTEQTQYLQVGIRTEEDGDFFPYENTSITVVGEQARRNFTYYFHATITDLIPNTKYEYRVGTEGNWSQTCTFTTLSASDSFTFAVFGDAQLGTNGKLLEEDVGLWDKALKKAMEMFNPEFLLHLGDEVESWEPDIVQLEQSELQYDVFYGNEVMRHLPYVGVIGNHEVSKSNWSNHHNAPNLTTYGYSPSGGMQAADYWLVANNVLILAINGNIRDTAQHDSFMEKAIADAQAQYGDTIKWKVAAMHQSMYGSSYISDEEDVVARRSEMSASFKKHGVDLVFAAHEHIYARSYMMDGTTPVIPEEGKENYCVNPQGQVLYITLGSSTGNKLFKPDRENKTDLAFYPEENVGQISQMKVGPAMLQLSTYTLEGVLVDEYTIYKTDPENVAPQINIKGENTYKVGDSFNALDGVTASDAIEGDLTAKIEVVGSVDTAKAGSYELTYKVVNSYGKTTELTRTVLVEKSGGCGGSLSSASLVVLLGAFALLVMSVARKKNFNKN